MDLRPEFIVRMAVELEKMGISFYRDLQRHFAADSDVYRTIEFLKTEEARHLEFFEGMTQKPGYGRPGSTAFSEAQAEKIRDFVDEKIFHLTRERKDLIVRENSIELLLVYASQTETDTVRYYKGIESFLPAEDRPVLQKIILEEQSHFEIILDLLAKIRTDLNKGPGKLEGLIAASSITNYRDRELGDLSVLNKILHALIERSETDVVTLVNDALSGFIDRIEPEMWMLFLYDRSREKCTLRHAGWRSNKKVLSGQFTMPSSSLLLHLAVGKKEALIIPDVSKLAEYQTAWDFEFCRKNEVVPRNLIILPLSSVGAIEIVNVRDDFDLALVNTLLINIIASIVHILFLEKEGLDRIGEFYRFLTFLSEETGIEEIYQKALKLITQEIGASNATIFHLSSDRNKLFLVEGINYPFRDHQFVPHRADQSFIPLFTDTVTALIGRENDIDATRTEIGIVERASDSKVYNYLVVPIVKEHGYEGELLVCNKHGGFRPQDVDFLDFIAKELSGILMKKKQVKEMTRMQQEGAFLSRYFSPNLLKRLKKGEEIQKEGIEEEVTVLFADIRGFTTMSESMAPKEVVRLLNAYFGRMVNIILQNDGVIDKFIGDAVFVYWGVPVKHKNDTLLAVLTAIAMQEELKFMKGKGILPENFHIGIGVNKGRAILGNIGSDERMEFTAIGDTINVASRLCGIAPGDEIIVSGPVYKDIFYDLEVVPFGKKILTGKTQEVLTYRVVSLKQDYFEIYLRAN